MITFISSSIKRATPVSVTLALAVLVTTTMSLVWCASYIDHSRPSAQTAAGQTQNRNSLRSALQTNFDVATQGMNAGRNSISAMPRDNSAGLVCNPATLDHKSKFRLILPAYAPDRKGVLAALPPTAICELSMNPTESIRMRKT